MFSHWSLPSSITFCCLASLAFAQAPTAADRDQHSAEAVKLRADGKLPAAIGEQQSAWKVEKELFGAAGQPESLVGERLIRWLLEAGQDDAAAKLLAEIRAAIQKQSPPPAWRLKQCDVIAAQIAAVKSWPAEKRDRLRQTGELTAQVLLKRQAGSSDEAFALGEKLQTIRAELWGTKHADYALSLYSRGSMLRAAGKLPEAEKALEEANMIWETQYGKASPFCAKSLTELGLLAMDQKDFVRSLQYATRAQQALAQTVGKLNGEYTLILNLIELAHRNQNQHAAAIAALEERAEVVKEWRGAESEDYANLLYEVGNYWFLLQDYEKAAPPLEKSRALFSRIEGGMGAATATVTCVLAQANLERGQGAPAAKLLAGALESLEKAGKAASLDYINGTIKLAEFHQQNKELDAALKLLERSDVLAVKLRGEHDFIAAHVAFLQGDIFYAQKEFAQAEQAYRKSVNRKVGSELGHSATSIAGLRRVVDSQVAQENYTRAEATAQEVIEAHQAVKAKPSAEQVDDLIALGMYRRRNGKLDLAIKAFDEARAIAEKAVGKNKFAYGRATFLLGQCLRLAKQRPDDAKQLLLEAAQVIERAPDSDIKYVAWANEELGELYKQAKEYAAAAERFAAAYPAAKKIYPADSGLMANLEWQWSVALLRSGKEAEAEKLWIALLPKYGKLKDWEQAALAAQQLSFAYGGRGDYKSALPYIERALAYLEKAGPGQDASIRQLMLLQSSFLNSAGEIAKAETSYQKLVALFQKVGETKSFRYGAALSGLAGVESSLGKFANSEVSYRAALQALESAPDRDPHYESATRLGLSNSLINLGKQPEGVKILRETLAVADQQAGPQWVRLAILIQRNIVMAHLSLNQFPQIIEIESDLIQRISKLEGPNSPNLISEFGIRAKAYKHVGNTVQARQDAAQVLALLKGSAGMNSFGYAEALLASAEMEISFGNYDGATPLLRSVEEVIGKLGNDGEFLRAQLLQTQAELYDTLGDADRADAALEQSVAILEKKAGERDERTLGALAILGAHYNKHGNLTKAEAVARRVLAIREKVDGSRHLRTALAMSDLASRVAALRTFPQPLAAERRKQLDQALELETKAGEILQQAAGRRSMNFANHLCHLASIHSEKKEFPQAFAEWQEAAEIYRQIDAKELISAPLSSAAFTAMTVGDFDQAAKFASQAADVEAARLGRQHDSYLVAAKVLFFARLMQRDFAAAKQLQREVLEADRAALNNAAGAMSDRQQMELNQKLRSGLDFYLSLELDLDEEASPIADVYSQVLGAKGSVFRRQLAIAKSAKDPQLQKLVARLESVSSEISSLSLGASGGTRTLPADRLKALSLEREQIETELADKSPTFGEERKASRVSTAELQQSLPPHVVLIDFLEYENFAFGALGPQDVLGSEAATAKVLSAFSRKLTAFVVHRDRVDRVELGPVAAIKQALANWGPQLASPLTPKRQNAARELKQLVWLPLEKLLTDKDQTVLIAADGVTARIPFAALPGKTDQSYLLDERLVSMAPVPQRLPTLLKTQPAAAVTATDKLLLIGDVDFLTPPASPTNRVFPEFVPLSGSATEIKNIAATWPLRANSKSSQTLSRAAASEAAFRRAAPDATFLHLATHGFIAPVQESPPTDPAVSLMRIFLGGSSFSLQSMRTPASPESLVNPAARSAIALAGANRPAASSADDDGLVTALDLAVLPLDRTKLVVLSACETAEGKVADGEGVLGMQRAFQTAGAESVVGTLWSVPDKATSLLMDRFYRNLWEKRLGRAQALREAQQWLRQEALKNPDIVRAGKKGAPIVPPAKPAELSPFWWAAFSLSGEWR
jgi:CHAT domain-containing protein